MDFYNYKIMKNVHLLKGIDKLMKPSLNEIKKKTIFMVCIVAVLLALLVLRVAYWQIIRGDELSSKAKAQQQGSSIVTASRGDIYDRNGKVLAESATVNTLICNPKDIEADGDSEVIAARLAPVLNMEKTSYERTDRGGKEIKRFRC